MQPFNAYQGLNNVNIIQGSLTSINDKDNRAYFQSADGEHRHLDYDVLLIATGVSNGFWRNAERACI